MKYDVCVVGGTGAVGSAIVRLFEKSCSVRAISSASCNLELEEFAPPKIAADIVINASGTYGGLRQYSTSGLISGKNYLTNLCKLLETLNPSFVLNISSASLENKGNFQENSAYRCYVEEKERIEKKLEVIFGGILQNLRCTNVISRYENPIRSGHSIASIYRAFREARDKIEIWSSEGDWREYINADDIALICQLIAQKQAIGTLSIGSGSKTYIYEIVNAMKEFFDFKGNITYTQPYKLGPLVGLVGIPSNFVSESLGFFPKAFDRSLHECLHSWKNF
jgi:nucleoside-diphosphate-sugar epimerase